jgi:hypothetical protein
MKRFSIRSYESVFCINVPLGEWNRVTINQSATRFFAFPNLEANRPHFSGNCSVARHVSRLSRKRFEFDFNRVFLAHLLRHMRTHVSTTKPTRIACCIDFHFLHVSDDIHLDRAFIG